MVVDFCIPLLQNIEEATPVSTERTAQIRTLLEKAKNLVRHEDKSGEGKGGTGVLVEKKPPSDKVWQVSTHQSCIERAVSLIQVQQTSLCPYPRHERVWEPHIGVNYVL